MNAIKILVDINKSIKKSYNSIAFTSIIDHNNLKNDIAVQHFTKFGPLAFLPISNTKTSVVFSVFDKELIKNNCKVLELIKHYNRLYKIKNFKALQKFPINLSFFSSSETSSSLTPYYSYEHTG